MSACLTFDSYFQSNINLRSVYESLSNWDLQDEHAKWTQTLASHQHRRLHTSSCMHMSRAHTSSNSCSAQMHPPPYLYLVGNALSPSLSPLTGADWAVIYAPRHTRCQTCRLWLHTGRFWRCCNVAVRLSSAEAICCAPGLNMESLPVSVGKRRSVLSVRNAIGDVTQGPTFVPLSLPLTVRPPTFPHLCLPHSCHVAPSSLSVWTSLPLPSP